MRRQPMLCTQLIPSPPLVAAHKLSFCEFERHFRLEPGLFARRVKQDAGLRSFGLKPSDQRPDRQPYWGRGARVWLSLGTTTER
jgi:hypothetical protein